MIAGTIFAPEISTLESQVAALQAQIAKAQSRITALGEADVIASGALQALQNAVSKISGLAPDAIATLKAATLNLFGGGDDQDGGSGNEPIISIPNRDLYRTTAPTIDIVPHLPQSDVSHSNENRYNPLPSPNGNGNGKGHKTEAVLGCDIVEISSEELKKNIENQATEATPELNGQSVELASLLEDAPESVLKGQAVEVSCRYPGEIKPLKLTHKGDGYEEWTAVEKSSGIISKEVEITIEDKQQDVAEELTESAEPAYIEFVQLTASVAYIRRRDGEIIAVYVGGNNKQKLRNWGDWLTRSHSVTNGYELRKGSRLDTRWEIKLTPMALKEINRLVECDFNKEPRNSYPSEPKVRKNNAVSAVSTELAEHPEQQDKNAIASIQPEPLVHKPAPAIEVEVSPTYAAIDPNDVPQGVRLQRIDDDVLVEYLVWIDVIARNNGVPTPTQKAVGRLVESSNGIEAYRPRCGLGKNFSTQNDAIAHLISAAGYKMADITAAVEMRSQPQAEGAEGAEGEKRIEEVEEIGVGDIVRSITIRDREYRVVGIKSDGLLKCDYLAEDPPLRLDMHPATVELVSKAPTPKAQNIPTPEYLESALESDDEPADAVSENIEVDDWVELIADGQNYQVISRKDNRLKLLSGNEAKFATLAEVRLVFKKPANFLPF